MELVSRWIADLILFIGRQAQSFWGNLTLLNFSWQQAVLDILLVAVLFYFFLLLIRGSRAVHILTGLMVVALVYWLSKVMQLVTLGWILDRFLTIVLVAIPVIFQQELRMALERLGHTKLFMNQRAHQIDKMIESLVLACETLAKNNRGALIVLQNTVPLKEYVDTGIPLDAAVSRELLESIFNQNSPLHDGAVIIRDRKIAAASCLLPHSSRSEGPLMGTRHKAALGISENTDAAVIVVSEEKGQISSVRDGVMEKNIGGGRLKEILTGILDPAKQKKLNHRHHSKI
jgi:diadenylate cyclase